MVTNKVAVVQMNSSESRSDNLRRAARLVSEAANQGAQLIALPELFNCLGEPESIRANAEPMSGATVSKMRELAKSFNITLLAGSFARLDDDSVFNASPLISPSGDILATYDKLHLFDIDIPGEVTFKESDLMGFGDHLCITATSVGTIGQATCYDLRFPALFQRLVEQGAEIIAIPSAFAMSTGRDHWEVLLRARAIENQCFVIAPNQFGRHGEKLQTYGRSMIIDPWGTVIAQAPDKECVIYAEIDMAQLKSVRRNLPCLDHRRDLHELPTKTG